MQMITIQMSGFLCKSATMPLPTRYILTTIKGFQMGDCIKFYLKGYQNYQKLDCTYSWTTKLTWTVDSF